MTQDNPTLTEKGVIQIYIDEGDMTNDLVYVCQSKSIAESLRGEILTALDQYPKLKSQVDALHKVSKVDLKFMEELKAENEELKSELQTRKISQIHNDDYVKRLQQENESLRQLKQIVAEWKIKFDEFTKFSPNWTDQVLSDELQQLLKGDKS